MMNRTSPRLIAIERAQAELLRQPVYLDTETTGLNPDDQIVDICIVDHAGAVLVDSLVKPTRRIPASASAIHGITDAMVQTAPTWPELWPRVQAALAGRRVAIYNADYDVRLLRQTHRAHGLPWPLAGVDSFCVMNLYAQFIGEWDARHNKYRVYRLDVAARRCNLPDAGPAHRARADALSARGVLHYVADQGGNQPALL
jgi:DNA polymerase III subunit epsilon